MRKRREKIDSKKRYQPPELVLHGTIADLTRTRSGNIADNNQFNCNHQGQNTNPLCGPVS